MLGGQAGPQLLGSYEAERRPVAQANTQLSVRNWEEATEVPRALGLDPSAASALQAIAGSPITAQLPSGGARGVVLACSLCGCTLSRSLRSA